MRRLFLNSSLTNASPIFNKRLAYASTPVCSCVTSSVLSANRCSSIPMLRAWVNHRFAKGVPSER